MTASFTDISPLLSEKVTVKGKELEVFGLGAEDFIKLFAKFPFLSMIMNRKEVKVTPELIGELAKMGPDAVATIMAFGIRQGDNPQQIAAAKKFGVSDQLKVFKKIFDLTFEGGVGPFVDLVNQLTTAMTVRDAPGAEDALLDQDRDPEIPPTSENVSPDISPAALVMDPPPPRSGNLRRVS